MRSRFFWIILSVISFVVLGTTVLHGEFLRREKEKLIDQQVRETATALLDSELGDLRKVEFEKVENILSEELGENRIGKFFVIRNNAGEILFESSGAKLLPISDLPRAPRWITIQEKGKYIRLLNLSLPKIPDRTLQVGLVIGQDLLSPGYFSRANLFFTAAIMVIGLFMAWMLTAMLMHPISRLSGFIGLAAQDSARKLELPPLPRDLKQFVREAKSKDELAGLLAGFENLIERVNRNYKMSRVWSYQMAHELKTPMALIEAKIANGRRLGTIQDSVAQDILVEVFETSETITSFLSWAELENSNGHKRLFVVPVSKVLTGLKQRFEITFPHRIEIKVSRDFSVMTNIQHLEHAIGNVVLNALVYSPNETMVTIEAADNSIRVIDRGTGLPTEVIERFGEPFNKGSNAGRPAETKGHGLGLALVHSICRIYEWELNIDSGGKGSAISIKFPEIRSEHIGEPDL